MGGQAGRTGRQGRQGARPGRGGGVVRGKQGGPHLGEHKPGRIIKPGRIKRAALSLSNQNYCIFLFFGYDPVYMPLTRRDHMRDG